MINASDEFRAVMKKRTDFKCFAEVTLADGDQLTFTDADFAASGNSLTDGAGASGLPLGAAVCRTVKLEVINTDGHLDGYDFFGARIRLYLTFALSRMRTERVELGTFTVSEPESEGETVTITAADDMILADKAYTPGVSGTVTLAALYRDVCDQCGLRYTTSTFVASDMQVAVPEEEHTCREMLGYIAMLAAGIARVDRSGAVQIISYTKDGGESHYLTDWTQLSTDTDDIMITGLEVQTDDGSVMTGEEGYVLTVENPLMAGQEAAALEQMGDVLLGLRLRRFDGSHVGYPLAECMDTVRLVDRRGREYSSVITDVTFAFGGLTQLSNSAEGVVRNGSRYVSPEAKARIEARKLVARERSDRERAIEALNKTLAEASGLYSTQEVQPDESVIYYLHDKPTIAESKNVMKLTADAIGFSTDGGKTYPFGFMVTGEMIMGVIQTEGLNADWIRFGSLQSQPDEEGNVNFSFDTKTGRAVVRNLTIQGKNLAETLDGTVASVEQQFYPSSSPTVLSGGTWQTTQPTWTQGKYVWTRQYVTYGSGRHAYLPSEGGVCVTGNTGADGENGTDGTNGVGIETVVAEYILSPSATAPEEDPEAKWGPDIPEPIDGMFIWTRQAITYSDGHTDYAGECCMTAIMGSIAQQVVDAQTQEDIFNKLTDGGKVQGFYIQDGKLYINAEFVKILNLIAERLQSRSGSYLLDLWAAMVTLKENNNLRVRLYSTATDFGVVQVFSGNVTEDGGYLDDDARYSHLTASSLGVGENRSGEYDGSVKCGAASVSDLTVRKGPLNLTNATISGNFASLWTGELKSGTASFTVDRSKYKFFIVSGNPGENSSAVSCIIPYHRLGTRYQITDNNYYVSFTLSATGITYHASNDNGIIKDVIGIK